MNITCEKLATAVKLQEARDEIQELRDQLNQILGKEEDGSVTEVIKAGAPLAGGLIQSAGTVYAVTKLSAANALTDVALEVVDEKNIWKELRNGTAKWTGTKGNGAKTSLKGMSTASKAVAANSGAAVAATAVAAKSAASIALLANLVNIAATLALNIATVKVFDARIEAEARGVQVQLDAVNNGMLRLYSKNQEDIAASNANVQKNREEIEAANNNINAVAASAQQARDTNLKLADSLSTARTDISSLQNELTQTRQLVNDNTADFQEVVDGLTGSLNTVESELGQAIEVINKYEGQIAENDARISYLELKIQEYNTKFEQVDLQYILIREELIRLDEDLQGDINDTNEKVETLEGKLALTQKWVEQNKNSGGVGVSGTKGAADSQTKLLDLTAKLGNNDNNTVITSTDLYNQTTKFDDLFEELLTDIDVGKVDQQQLDDFGTGLSTDLKQAIATIIAGTISTPINDIRNQTSTNNIAKATEQGICQSLNTPSPCQGGGATPTQGLKGLGNILKGKQEAILAALQAADLAQGAKILSVVQDTNGVIKNAKHGLEAVQNFAAKAWEATGADKILNAITTAVVIHNGVQLSTNLTATIGETASVVLDAVGIKDSATGNPIDVNSVIRAKMTSMINSMIGAENYAVLSAKLAGYNRIYQAGANVFDATRDLFDSARSVSELTAENTGKIGNALLESGAVLEDSYDEMIDKVNPQSKAMQRLEKFREGLEQVEDTVSTIGNISSEVVSTKDSFQELKEAKTEWKEINQALVNEKKVTKQVTKLESEVTADINDVDFDAGESQD